MHAERHFDDEVLYIHVEDLSRATMISTQRLRQMAREGHYPLPENGYLDLYATLPGIVKFLRGTGQADQQRLKKAKADLAEMEAAQMRGTLVKVEDIAKHWVEMISRHKAKLLSLPNRAAPVLAAEEDPTIVQSLMSSYLEEALVELADADLEEDYSGEDEGDGFIDESEPVIEREDIPVDLGPDGYDDDDDPEDDASGFDEELEAGGYPGERGGSAATPDDRELLGGRAQAPVKRGLSGARPVAHKSR